MHINTSSWNCLECLLSELNCKITAAIRFYAKSAICDILTYDEQCLHYYLCVRIVLNAVEILSMFWLLLKPEIRLRITCFGGTFPCRFENICMSTDFGMYFNFSLIFFCAHCVEIISPSRGKCMSLCHSMRLVGMLNALKLVDYDNKAGILTLFIRHNFIYSGGAQSNSHWCWEWKYENSVFIRHLCVPAAFYI